MYNKNFYKNQTESSYQSALKICDILEEFIFPNSTIDIGCGKGTWLKAFSEKFSCETFGVEGSWIAKDGLLIVPNRFWNRDLNKPLDLNFAQKFDLAISLEVAEHLRPESSESFVDQLTKLSDCVLFSAAQPGQGGIYHTNEKFPSDWCLFFQQRGFECFDVIRCRLSKFPEVPSWYRQNMYLYVNQQSNIYSNLTKKNILPIENRNFLNMVTTNFYLERISFRGFLKYHILKMLPSKLVANLHGWVK